MNEKQQVILSVVEKILHKPKRNYKGIVQYEFNCPSPWCKNDKDKFNWTFNSEKNVFRCWKCKYAGVIHKFVAEFGTKQDLERVNLVLPQEEHKKFIQDLKNNQAAALNDHVVCDLPEGYRPLTQVYDSVYYRAAMSYLEGRKIGMDWIKRYNIGYTESGPRKFRIIIPSYNCDNNVNYFEARAYMDGLTNYYKPDSPKKSEIIFNARNVNFDLPVYLTEGVFDMFPLYNCVPLLGKDISELLLSKLLEHKSKVILCLDEDAARDSVAIYNKLTELGLDVYFVYVKDDIAKCFQEHGKEGVDALIKNFKKLTKAEINKICAKDKENNRNKKNKVDERLLEREWMLIQKAFKEQL